jgi:hypothetical protein
VLQLCRSALISWADMVLAPSVAGLFKWHQFEQEMILLAVGWYLRFSLSHRDVEELLAERGLLVDHVTVWRWVHVTPHKFSADPATLRFRCRSQAADTSRVSSPLSRAVYAQPVTEPFGRFFVALTEYPSEQPT